MDSVKRLTVALCAVQFVDVMTTTLVIASLPSMLADLDASPGAAGLVVPAYAVLFGSLLVLGARLSDRFGHLRVLRAGVVGFAAASVLSAVAPSLAVVVVGRCLLGIAAAISVPSALRLLLHTNPSPDPRRRALALWSASGAAAGASGLLVGGLLTDWLGWRALFWPAVPVAGLLLLVLRGSWGSPATGPDSKQGPARARLDLPGAVILVTAVALAIGGATLLQEPTTRTAGVLLIICAGPLLALLRTIERRAADPLLPNAALHHPNLRTGSAVSFANTATTSSAVTLATIHLQDSAAYTATGAALLLLPFSLSVIAGSASAPRALSHAGPRRTAAAGLALISLGCAALLATPALPPSAALAVAVAGYGIGLASVAATTLGTDVPATMQTLAAGFLNTAAQLGTAIGVAAVLTTTSLVSQAASADAGAQAGWLLAATVAATTSAMTFRRRRELSERVVSEAS